MWYILYNVGRPGSGSLEILLAPRSWEMVQFCCVEVENPVFSCALSVFKGHLNWDPE